MKLPLEFHPLVRVEVDEAYRWYEERRAGLGREFLDELGSLLDEIAGTPFGHGFADAGKREAILKRFPYAVYYRVRRDRVRVLAVYHASRDPSGWRRRR